MSTLPRVSEAYERFRARFPDYERTAVLDELRVRDFSRLDEQHQVYLDYTGSGLYGVSQVRTHADALTRGIFGNPHSTNPSSQASGDLIERCRRRILRFFNGDPAEYAVIFTANASVALKLVGESYPFERGSRFLLTFDNHNSVNGIREFDRARGAQTIYVPMIPPDLRVDEHAILQALAEPVSAANNLFAYPAQSNFSGVQHPLEWVGAAKSRGWDVLLDVAAFVPTNRLDLASVRPDFVALSFYKMFGYPTGVGALIARHESLGKLHRPWFAGGTISVASVQADRYVPAVGGAAFEDGTLDFTNIPAVEIGLDLIERVGYPAIAARVRSLTGWLLDELLALRHANGAPLVRIYGPSTVDRRGGTISFNFYTRNGVAIDHRQVEARACALGISLRTGCFCNPGAGEVALGLSRPQLEACFSDAENRMTYDDLRRCVDPSAAGAVRVSLGLVSNFHDVFTFAQWAREFRDAD